MGVRTCHLASGDLDLCDLLGTLDTNLSGLSTRNDLRMVRSKGNEESATIVTRLCGIFMSKGENMA